MGTFVLVLISFTNIHCCCLSFIIIVRGSSSIHVLGLLVMHLLWWFDGEYRSKGWWYEFKQYILRNYMKNILTKSPRNIFYQDYYVSGELCWCKTKEDEKKRYNGLHTFITAEGKNKTSAKCIKLPGFYHKNDIWKVSLRERVNAVTARAH